MRNNFRVEYNVCGCCKRSDEIHLGMYASGWCFQAHENLEIQSWKDWKKFINAHLGVIKDDDDKVYSIVQMEHIVKRKSSYNYLEHDWYCLDEEGYLFSKREFD